MNVTVEKKPHCVIVLSIEIPAERVAIERGRVTGEFVRHARVPGFRPGKAPRSVVENRFAKDIGEQLKEELVRMGFREAIEKEKLEFLQVEASSEPQTTPGGSFQFTVTLLTAPEFELPDYSSIPLELTREPVTEEIIESALNNLREGHATFDPVEGRAAALGDYVVISYAGTIDGTPASETLPDIPTQISGRRHAWLLLVEDVLVPGFAAQIVGLEPGADKSFPITFPEDYFVEALRGKTIEYAVTLHGINTQNIPEWSDELADKIEPGCTLEALRKKVREAHERMSDKVFENRKRWGAADHLLGKVEYDLPERYVNEEARQILSEIIDDNLNRGATLEELNSKDREILDAAKARARERVRRNFLLLRIASVEKLEITREELAASVAKFAQETQTPIKKFMTHLKKRDGLEHIREYILSEKALDLLASRVTLVPSAAETAEKPA